MNNEFKWDDKAVMEFYNFHREREGLTSESIQVFKESKQPKSNALFISEDLKNIYDQDVVFSTTTLEGAWKCDKTIARKTLLPIPSYYKYFSTKDACIEFIKNNKPCLSLIDVLNCERYTKTEPQFISELKSLIQSKIYSNE